MTPPARSRIALGLASVTPFPANSRSAICLAVRGSWEARSASRAARYNVPRLNQGFWLAPPHGDPAHVVARRQHLHDRLDLHHGDGQAPTLLGVVQELAGQLGMKLA